MTNDHSADGARITFTAYLAARLDAIATHKDLTAVANEIGYENSRIIEMFKSGEARVTLDKVAKLARAVGADPAFMGHLWLADALGRDSEVFQPIVTANEFAILEVIRQASRYSDPAISELQKRQLAVMFCSDAVSPH
jgi:hypothetical protein